MTNDEKLSIEEFHKKIAVETNNAIWPVLDKENPSEEELEDALDMAHASRYHWNEVGKPINLARADYMISRVASAMGRAESALHHAKRCLEITKDTGVGDWDLAFAYEAMTRAYAVGKNREKFNECMEHTRKAISEIDNKQDKEIVQGELDKISFPS
jgi:tetratricopeptide (TPR) repeat protein